MAKQGASEVSVAYVRLCVFLEPDSLVGSGVNNNVYTELAPKFVGNGFCSSGVEHWSSNPKDGDSIPSRKALELCFSQLHGPGLGRIVYIFTTLEFPTHN